MSNGGKSYPANQLKQMKKQTGFACLPPNQVKELAAQGGRASHLATTKDKRAHEWTADTARQAALKSWESRRKKAAMQQVSKLSVAQGL